MGNDDKKVQGANREDIDLCSENLALRAENSRLIDYVRQKTDGLLKVMGTIPLKAEELDDATLIEFDPIGIVTSSFTQVLANLRNTNQKLQLAHQEIQAIFDSVGSAVLVLDPDRNIVAYNEKIRNKLFFGDGDPVGQYCRDAICQDTIPESHCVHSRVMQSGQPEKMPGWEFNERCFDVIGQPIKNVNGELTHVVLAYSDVTEHRLNSIALQAALVEMHEAKAQIDGLLKSMSDGLIANDAKGRLVLMNPAAEKLLETSFGLCLGKTLHELISIPKLKAYFYALAVGGTDFSCDFEFENSDGVVRTYQARTSEMLKRGDVSGRITFLHDVSREREIDRMKDEFLSTAAHQLRTPLASVIGFAELIMDSESLDDSTRDEYISMIYGKAEQLSEIVSNLLDISRIESGSGLSIVQEPVLVDALIDEALENIHRTSVKHQFDVKIKKDISIFADRFAMLQVLENLFSNAVKYSPDGGDIRLEGELADGNYRLSMTDHGLGMTAEQVEQVFKKFYRADASNTAISGTGLGLTIVRYLVEAHGGSVKIESKLGSGTSVHLILPLAS